MRRILKIFLIVALVFLVIYAFVEPVRGFLQTNLGPPLMNLFGGFYTMITTSSIWINYVAPPLNLALICFTVGLIAYHFLVQKAKTKFRRVIIKGAAKESGMYPVETEPVSQPIRRQPAPTEVKEETAPPPPQPKPTEREAEA